MVNNNKPNFSFSEWLKQEMTSVGSVSGGGSFTNSIAGFARPIFAAPVERIKRKRTNLKHGNIKRIFK